MDNTIHTEQYKGYTIHIIPDPEPQSPREDDNGAHFICWHRHYILGDAHKYADPQEFRDALGRELANGRIEKLARTRDDKLESISTKWYAVPYEKHTQADYVARELAETAITDKYDALIQSALDAAIEKDCIIVPIRAYEHGGITISAGASYPYNDVWDSYYVGYAYMTREEVVKAFGKWDKGSKERARKLILAEISAYDDYLTGNIYGYEVTDNDGEVVDSCWGFYGDYDDYCLKEARIVVDSLDAERTTRRVAKEQELNALKTHYQMA